jgi:murein DD-endopeptidase MepM/ murein hydrolase activator NlpD
MRRWEPHRTRSKVVVLLLINLVALLGGKYTALITVLTLEWFGEAVALAKAPKKKLPQPPLSRDPHDSLAPPTTTPAGLDDTPRRQTLLWHVIGRDDTVSTIAASYGVSVAALRQANYLGPTSRLVVGEALRIPVAAAAQDRGALPHGAAAADGGRRSGGRRQRTPGAPASLQAQAGFRWPVAGALTSPYGERDDVMGGAGVQFHAGIDLSVPTGTLVVATQSGLVVFAGQYGAYGKAVKLDHAQGFSTLYAHNSRLLVQVGQRVKAGEVICLSGNTGRSTGPHVHFELHKDGWPMDPLPYLP